jgi:hypothetical protein
MTLRMPPFSSTSLTRLQNYSLMGRRFMKVGLRRKGYYFYWITVMILLGRDRWNFIGNSKLSIKCKMIIVLKEETLKKFEENEKELLCKKF